MITTIYQYLNFIERKYGDRITLQYVDHDNRCVQKKTFREFAADVRKCAMYLKATIPDIKQQKIGLLAKNSYHYAVSLMGVMLSGAVVVPLNFEEPPENIRYELEFAEIRYLLHDGNYFLREENGSEDFAFCNKRKIDEYVKSEETAELEDCDDIEKMSMILFTSGTTGRSKGVMLSSKNIFTPLKTYEEIMEQISKNTTIKVLVTTPLYHISGFAFFYTNQFMGNVCNLCCDIKYIKSDLLVLESNLAFAVPTVLEMWYKDLKRGRKKNLGGLRCIGTGAAPVNKETLQLFIKNGIRIVQIYGMTEIFGGGTSNSSIDPEKLGSVGIPGRECELKILDDGEICLKSDAVMLGYYNDPEDTAKAIQDGWLHTGDLGYLDEDGYLYLTGRKKNLIILSGGENVNPEELEQLLLKEPDIKEVLIKEKGNKIVAEIFCNNGTETEIQEYITEVNRKLPFYKRITKIEFKTEPFQKTATGKIKR